MNKTKDELFQENLNCYGDNFNCWPEKVKAQFQDYPWRHAMPAPILKNTGAILPWPSVDKLNADWAALIEAAGPVEDEPEDPRADPESDVFDPLAVVKGEVKPKRKPSKSKPNKKGK